MVRRWIEAWKRRRAERQAREAALSRDEARIVAEWRAEESRMEGYRIAALLSLTVAEKRKHRKDYQRLAEKTRQKRRDRYRALARVAARA